MNYSLKDRLVARNSRAVHGDRPLLQPVVYAALRWVLLISVIVSAAGVWIWQDYHHTLDSAAVQQANVARLLETHTDHVIANVDGVLERVIDEIRDHDIMGKGADLRWPFLKKMAEKLPVSGRLWIYRADGSAVMASHLRHSTNNATDREYFTAQRVPGVGLFIGETVTGKTTGKKVFNISRRINAPDGSFAGVAMAAIDIDVFIQAVTELELGTSAAYTLARSDGAIIMRHPDAGAAGKRFNLNILKLMKTQRSGLITTVSAIDGITRQVVFRKPPHLPLGIVVSLSREEILAPWYQRALILGVSITLLFVFAGWLTLVARRANKRESAMVMRMQTVLDTVADGICGVDAEGRIAFINPAGAELFGCNANELVGKGLHETTHHSRPDGTPYAADECPIHDLLNAGSEKLGTDYFWRRDGQGFAAEYSATRVDELDGHHGVVMSFRDVTARKAGELALQRSEEFARTTIDAVPEHICVLDPSGRIISVNRAWHQFYDENAPDEARRNDYFIGSSYFDASHVSGDADAKQAAEMETGIRKVMSGELEYFSLEYACDSKTEQRTFVAHASRFHGDSGNVLIRHENVTERKRAERELEHLAQTDALTGLANRRHFMALAERELSRTVRYGGELSALMLDIDHFKRVNDTHGHHTGDLVLERLGRICRESFRDVDIIGRLGGEEFAVLLPQTGEQQAFDVAERLRQIIEASALPLSQGQPLHFTVSIGVVTLADTSVNLDTFLGFADKGLYDAKHGGRNQVCIYGKA